MQIDDLLALTCDRRASDLHLSAGHPPLLRIDGDLHALSCPAYGDAELDALLRALAPEDCQRRLLCTLSCDFTLERANAIRFRVGAIRHRLGLALALRPIPARIPSLESLACPRAFQAMAAMQWGLIVVCGATGSGKTTLLAALIDHINRHRRQHILIFEEPIEYIHQSRGCLIHQCALSPETQTDVLRTALRADPDILVIGEMRDRASVELALRSAQTGHLVLSTLHAANAAQAVERLIESFDASEKDSVRIALSESLRAVIAQRLIKRASREGRIAQREILMVTPAVARLIREHKTAQLDHIMQTGEQHGMTTFAQSRRALLASGAIADADGRECDGCFT